MREVTGKQRRRVADSERKEGEIGEKSCRQREKGRGKVGQGLVGSSLSAFLGECSSAAADNLAGCPSFCSGQSARRGAQQQTWGTQAADLAGGMGPNMARVAYHSGNEAEI